HWARGEQRLRSGRSLLRRLHDLLDAPGVEEVLLRDVVVKTVRDLLEPADGVAELHVSTRLAGEYLGGEEGLAEEALGLPRPGAGELVVLAELVNAEDGDDVLQLLVPLENSLDLAGNGVVLGADDVRVEDPAGGVERIHRRIDTELRDRAAEHRRRIEVR